MNKKIIKSLFLMSAISVTSVGGYYLYNVNTSKILNISKVEDNDNNFYYRTISISDKKEVEKYNILKVASCEVVFNNETSEYELSITYKNNSNKDINNLNLNAYANGIDSQVILDNISKESLLAGSEFSETWILSKDNLREMYSNDLKNKEDNDITEDEINKLLQNEMSNIGIEYTYDNDLNENLHITQYLDFNGNEKLSDVKIYKEFESSNDLKFSHVDNGSYLNLIEPEDMNIYNYIKVKSIEVNIDNDLNFNIIAKFKNNSEYDISNFEFKPTITFNQISPFNSNQIIESNKKALIKAGKEFEFSIKINKKNIIDSLSKINSDELKVNFNGSDDELLNYLIKNRMISIFYSYDYEIDNTSYSTSANYSNSSKLQVLYINVSDKNSN